MPGSGVFGVNHVPGGNFLYYLTMTKPLTGSLTFQYLLTLKAFQVTEMIR